MNVFISETPMHISKLPQVIIHTGEFAESFGYVPKAMARVLALAVSNDDQSEDDRQSIVTCLLFLENLIPIDYEKILKSESGLTHSEVISKINAEFTKVPKV